MKCVPDIRSKAPMLIVMRALLRQRPRPIHAAWPSKVCGVITWAAPPVPVS